MTPLPQQLEDKKKGCGCITAGNEEFGTMNCGDIWGKWDEDKWIDDKKPTYCDKCKVEIAILEQAIAEKKKRDEEVDNAIDFLSSYPIWTKIYHKEDGDTEEIPDKLYPILDNFVKMIQKVLKEQLQSQQDKSLEGESKDGNLTHEPVTYSSASNDEIRVPCHGGGRATADISNLLQKQRQEEIEFLRKLPLGFNNLAEKRCQERIEYLEQLNRQKTENGM